MLRLHVINELPSFVVLSSLAHMEVIKKQNQTSKQTENINTKIKVKVNAKTKIRVKTTTKKNKVKS